MGQNNKTFTYQSLRKKYSGFHAPTIEVFVDNKELVQGDKLHIWNLEVELTSGYEASGCAFEINGAYNYKNSNFENDVSGIQIGAQVEIKMGYVRTETVFYGYINQVEYRFGGHDENKIMVECMDAKGLLMKNRRMEIFSQKQISGVIKSILGEAPVSSYIKSKEITDTADEQVPIRSNACSDYELIVEQAAKLGYEFYICQGCVFFRKKESVTNPVMKLTPRETIAAARVSLSGQKLANSVCVRSIDQTSGKAINGEENIKGKFSSGTTAKKMLNNTRQYFYEAGVSDVKEAKARAAARLDTMTENFGELLCECIGLPEIVPGRFVDITDLAKPLNKQYYITTVRHTIDDDGFRTIFTARLKSL